MKRILIALGLMFFGMQVYAARVGSIQDPQYYSEAVSSAAVYGVSCASHTGTQVDASSYATFVGTRAWVRIQNHDASASVYCGFNVSVSTIPSESALGEKIAAGGSATYPLTHKVSIYCKTDAEGATSRISVLQLYYKERD